MIIRNSDTLSYVQIIQFVGVRWGNLYIQCNLCPNISELVTCYFRFRYCILPNKCTCLNKYALNFWLWLAISQELLNRSQSSFYPSISRQFVHSVTYSVYVTYRDWGVYGGFVKQRSAFSKGYVFTCHWWIFALNWHPLLHATCSITVWTLVIIIIKTRFLLNSRWCLCIALKDIIFRSNFLQFEVAIICYIRHLSHLGRSYNTHLPGLVDAFSSSILVVTIYEHLS